MNIIIENIGADHLGIDGSDQYVLLKCLDDYEQSAVHDWLRERNYRDCRHPGGYFCHYVTVIPHVRANVYIGIIHHRYDV